MGRKLTLKDIHVENRRVLIRTDFNVPIKDGAVDDRSKIEAHVPTIEMALAQGARAVILMSSLGKPQGRKIDELSLQPVAYALSDLLNKEVIFVHDCVGAEAAKACAHPEPGSIILLENLRFHPEEQGFGLNNEGEYFHPSEDSRKAFINSLSHLGDIFVNDAFKSIKHEQCASFYIDLPKRVAGLFIDREIKMLNGFRSEAKRPIFLFLGGSKLDKKAELYGKIMNLLNVIFLGGEPALALQYLKIGASVGEYKPTDETLKAMKKLIEEAQRKGVIISVPSDYLCANHSKPAEAEHFDLQTFRAEDGIPEGWTVMDIGPETTNYYKECLLFPDEVKTVFWNGPLGNLDHREEFGASTKVILDTVVELTQEEKITSIIAGRSICYYANRLRCAYKLSYWTLNARTCLQFLAGLEMFQYHNWLLDEEQAKIRVMIIHENYPEDEAEPVVISSNYPISERPKVRKLRKVRQRKSRIRDDGEEEWYSSEVDESYYESLVSELSQSPSEYEGDDEEQKRIHMERKKAHEEHKEKKKKEGFLAKMRQLFK